MDLSAGSHSIFSWRGRIWETKHDPPLHSTKLVQMPVRVADLAFDLFVLYYRSPCTLQVPSPVKNTGKEGDCKYKIIQ